MAIAFDEVCLRARLRVRVRAPPLGARSRAPREHDDGDRDGAWPPALSLGRRRAERGEELAHRRKSVVGARAEAAEQRIEDGGRDGAFPRRRPNAPLELFESDRVEVASGKGALARERL